MTGAGTHPPNLTEICFREMVSSEPGAIHSSVRNACWVATGYSRAPVRLEVGFRCSIPSKT
jgi:hypothetical protein